MSQIYRSVGALVGLALALAVPAQAKTSTLKVGDAAPAISVAKWVKGSPVPTLEKGKVYVVEFWATWCGPCKVSIPHLTELQKKFGDKATFIGVSAFENNWSGVEPFVQSEGDQMDYHVAMDHVANPSEREGDMAKNWMIAANQNGIPTAFVIDRTGKIAWIGHPMMLEEPLTQIVAGTWDSEKFARQQAAQAEAAANSPMAKFSREFGADLKAKNWQAALKVIDANEKLFPAGASDTLRLDVYIASGDETNYGTFARKLMAGSAKDNAQMLNQLAWYEVDPKSKFQHRDLKLAKEAAERAVELSKHGDGTILDTLAWVYYWSGDHRQAISIENDAITKVPAAEKSTLQQSLDTFNKN